MRGRVVLAAAVALFLLPAAPAAAATCNFIGAQEDDWHDDTNWDCGVIPDGDDAVVISSGPDIVRVNQNESAASVELTGGAIRLAGGVTLNVSGPFTVTFGTVNGLGTRATMSVGGGMTHASDQFRVADDVDVVIAGASTVSGSSTIQLDDGFGTGAGGDPSIRFDGALDLTASNTVVDGAGLTVGWRAFRIGATGSLSRTTAGTALINVLSENAGTITVGNAQTIGFSSLGWVQVSGTTTVNAGGTLDGPMTMEGGLLTGSGALNGVQNHGGTISPATGATLTIGGMGQTAGQTSIASGEKLDINVSGANQTGGTTTVASGGELEIVPTSSWSVNGGTLTVAGTVTGAIFMNDPASVLNGAGTITDKVTVFQGTVAPGSSTGTLTMGSFEGGSGAVMAIEIGGAADFDVLAVTGDADLGGDVAVALLNGYSPQPGATFQFVTSASRSGQFDTPVTGGGGGFTVDYPGSPLFGARLVSGQSTVPSNTGLPVIEGTPAPGQTVTCDPGSWTNNPSFTYQWQLDGVDIGGATGATHGIVAGDAGHDLTCVVTATTAGGSAQATSEPVTVQTPGVIVTPTPTPTPLVTATPTPSPSPPAATPAEEKLAAASPGAVAKAFKLPSARRCRSRRNFTIRLVIPTGVTVKAAKVVVNKKTVRTRLVNGRYTARVDLRGFPKGRFTVKLTVTTMSGKTLRGKRAYRTCIPKRKR